MCSICATIGFAERASTEETKYDVEIQNATPYPCYILFTRSFRISGNRCKKEPKS